MCTSVLFFFFLLNVFTLVQPQVQLSTNNSYGNRISVDNQNDFRFKIQFQNICVVLNYRCRLSQIFNGRFHIVVF